MSNNTTPATTSTTFNVGVVDNRLQGLPYREAFKADMEDLEVELAAFVWQLRHHYYMLKRLEWLEEESPWQEAIQAYNS